MPTHCRSCNAVLNETFLDLGASPLANAFLSPEDLCAMEPTYPLRVYVCTDCWLVQLAAVVPPTEIFVEYPYLSSYSSSWLEHAARYVEHVTARFGLTQQSNVIEVASNDGYLLRNFIGRGIRVLGIEPARNVAAIATERGVPTEIAFFGKATAERLVRSGRTADLLIANNVLAHVPDLNDFIAGLKLMLSPGGVVTIEFPHLLRLVEDNQFDTIYHEHLSYFSFLAVENALRAHDITVFDVQELRVHGGSLRIFGKHTNDPVKSPAPTVQQMRLRERASGVDRLDFYRGFERRVAAAKRELLRFLITVKDEGQRVAGYGAPAKGNTLLNYCGVGTDFIDFTVDRNEHKQGKYLPGSRIPIFRPEQLREYKPDYVLILPWNLRHEIVAEASFVRDWGGRFVVPIPRTEVLL